MNKQTILEAIAKLYPEGFKGFDAKFPTPPPSYPKFVQSVESTNAKGGEQFTIHTEDELLTASQEFRAEKAEAEALKASRKVWANAHDFLDEFTDDEVDLLMSAKKIKALSVRLAAWKGEVWSNDPRIEGGMAALVQVNVLTQERHDEIMST